MITMQPVRQGINAGQTATFSVIATGTAPLNYQWQKNGTAILGATSSTYTTPVTAASGDGTLFTVVVSNVVGSLISSPATLSVNSTPGQLTINPTNLAFGTLSIGSQSAASVTLSNASSSYITISNVSVSGAGFDASGVPSGIIMAPGQTATLNVVFAPAGTGSVAGSIIVSSDATNSPTSIPVSGTGVQPTHWVTLNWDPGSSFSIRLLRVPGDEPVRAEYKIEFHTDHDNSVYGYHRPARSNLPLLGNGCGRKYAREFFLGCRVGNHPNTIKKNQY